MVNMVLSVVFGGIAGYVASLLVGVDAALGLWGNVIVGIVGSFLGGFIAEQMGAKPTSDALRPTSYMGFVWAVLGAVVLLFILNIIF